MAEMSAKVRGMGSKVYLDIEKVTKSKGYSPNAL
jgi:hypothetical protein